VGELPGGLQVLVVAIGPEALVPLGAVASADSVSRFLGERGPVAGHADTLPLPQAAGIRAS
jgi:hypothetical protein